jgi:hypothetical protein
MENKYIIHGFDNITHTIHKYAGGISYDEYKCNKCDKIFTNKFDFRISEFIEGQHIWKTAVQECVGNK